MRGEGVMKFTFLGGHFPEEPEEGVHVDWIKFIASKNWFKLSLQLLPVKLGWKLNLM